MNKSDHYRCYNHPPHKGKPGMISVQDGWTLDGRRNMRVHFPKWLPIECGHIDRFNDPRCIDCRWKNIDNNSSIKS